MPEEDGTARVELDQQGDQQPQRRQPDEHDGGHREVHGALERHLSGRHQMRLELHQRHAVNLTRAHVPHDDVVQIRRDAVGDGQAAAGFDDLQHLFVRVGLQCDQDAVDRRVDEDALQVARLAQHRNTLDDSALLCLLGTDEADDVVPFRRRFAQGVQQADAARFAADDDGPAPADAADDQVFLQTAHPEAPTGDEDEGGQPVHADQRSREREAAVQRRHHEQHDANRDGLVHGDGLVEPRVDPRRAVETERHEQDEPQDVDQADGEAVILDDEEERRRRAGDVRVGPGLLGAVEHAADVPRPQQQQRAHVEGDEVGEGEQQLFVVTGHPVLPRRPLV